MRKLLMCFIALCILQPVAPARAQTGSVYIEDLTWPELKARMERGATTVIIPTGGTEQNGPHLSIGKHNRIVYYTAGEIARKLGNAVVAPVVAYVPQGRISPPEGHMRFPGTISLREETFAMLLEDTARSFKQHGFRLICFVGDSKGNQNAQEEVARRLSDEWRSLGVRVLHVADYFSNNGQEEWAERVRPEVRNPNAHAGFFDTAELLAVDQSQVRKSMIQPHAEKDYIATGAAGDPTPATVADGRVLLGLKINAAVTKIQHLTGAGGKPAE